MLPKIISSSFVSLSGTTMTNKTDFIDRMNREEISLKTKQIEKKITFNIKIIPLYLLLAGCNITIGMFMNVNVLLLIPFVAITMNFLAIWDAVKKIKKFKAERYDIIMDAL